MFEIEEKCHVQHDTNCGGDGGGQTDVGEAGVRLDAHIVGEGKADTQRLDHCLDHDPHGLAVAVKISHHAEQYCRYQGLRSEALQILIASLHYRSIRRENTRQQISFEEHQCKGEASYKKSDADTGKQGLFCPFLFAGSYIL